MKRIYPRTKRIRSLNTSAKSAGICFGEGVYFDYAATTPVDPRAVKAMIPYYSDVFGNPGSLHRFGQEASAAVFKARNEISKLINCDYREIIFTGSATEANNLALRGVVNALIQNSKIPGRAGKNQNYNSKFKNNSAKQNTEILNFDFYSLHFRPRIIVLCIEHESVLETAKELEGVGVEVVYLPVSKDGIVDLKKLKNALNERTVLVSIMYANNEVGSVQPIKEISEIISQFKEKKISFLKDVFLSNIYPLFHCDAAQAFNYLDCDIKNLGVDMITLSSQKIYGPKGVGLLYIKNFGNFQGKKFISPIIIGGGQEEGLRSGTENVAGIVGFAEAAQISFELRKKESERLLKLQNYFLAQLKKLNFSLNGPGMGEKRLPNNLNVYCKRKKDLIFKLDMAGFAVSGGSACSAHIARPSHVLKAMGFSNERASESIRISLGRQTNKKSIDIFLKIFKNIK